MRIRIVLTLVVVGAIGALLVGVPPGSARGPNDTFRDAIWMPRNLMGIVLYETGHTPGRGHLAPYRSLDGRERAESDLAWLRITEVYAPSHPSHYMDTRRSLGYANAALGQYGHAARRMREAALYPNEEEFFGGSLNILDWQQAVYFTYEAHGIEASLEVWREGRDALRLNEDSYLDAAIEDGSVLIADADILSGEAPIWWAEELDHFEDRYAAETRTVLVERLLDDGEPAAARELMDAIEAGGFAGWPLTLARIRVALIDLENDRGHRSANDLASLTRPILDNWAVISDRNSNSGPGLTEVVRVLRLHDRLDQCDPVRQTLDHLVQLSLEGAEAGNRPYPIAPIELWRATNRVCILASLPGGEVANSSCQRRDELWQQDANGLIQREAWDTYRLPAVQQSPPRALECYAGPPSD